MKPEPGPTDYKSLMASALIELEAMESKLRSLERSQSEPIAVVGMSCRFPGADNLQAFWELLRDGRQAISEVPPDRWDWHSYYDPDPDAAGKTYARHCGFLEGLQDFDAHFFNIAPREAPSLDPQQRLLLEVTWEALENAGVAPLSLKDSQTGVFLGMASNDYSRILLSQGLKAIDPYMATGTAHSVAAGRLSYFLSLKGPSIGIDTACSSSLVAIHMACQNLRARECDLALAGGVNCLLSPDATINLSKLRMLSPTGRCHTFDDSADGFVRAEGCGIVVLRRLSDVAAHRETVLAVIHGSAVNHDGHTSGLTVPSGPSQQQVIREALKRADLAPSDVAYIEAHGTGTSLGDPIEIGALEAVFNKDRAQGHPLIVGSAKTNIGHAEAAAGVAGMIKVVLSLRNDSIPPHLNFQEPSKHIPWDRLHMLVPVQTIPWPGGASRRRIAGVSSFGFGGTNAHVVVEAAAKLPADQGKPAPESALKKPSRYLLPISARSSEAFRELAERYVRHLASHPDLGLEDLCYTAAAGRSHFAHRAAVIGASLSDLQQALGRFLAGQESASVTEANETRLSKFAFLFSGEGSQHVGMGRELYNTHPTFRRIVDRCDRVFASEMGESLISILYGEDAAKLERTVYAQPALYAIQTGLAELWREWGIEPTFVLGHGAGELAAACVAGVFSIEDGARLMCARARLLEALPEGAMVAVSGRRAEVAQPMLEEFGESTRRVKYAAPQLGMLSGVTGTEARGEVTKAEYWVEQVVRPAVFAAGLKWLKAQGVEAFVEIGPADWEQMLTTLANLYTRGADVRWYNLDPDPQRRVVSLPTYPFQRRRYWPNLNKTAQTGSSTGRGVLHPLLGARLRSALQEFQFESGLSADSPPYLKRHVIFDHCLVPAAVFIEMALAAAQTIFRTDYLAIHNLTFDTPLVLDEQKETTVQVIAAGTQAGNYDVRIYSQSNDDLDGRAEWVLHARGNLGADSAGDLFKVRPVAHAAAFEAAEEIDLVACVQHLGNPPFAGEISLLQRLWRRDGTTFARIVLPDALQFDADEYVLHPVLLNACFLALLPMVPENADEQGTWVPVGVELVRSFQRASSEIWCEATLRPASTKEPASGALAAATADFRLFSPGGDLVALVEGVQLRHVTKEILLGGARAAENPQFYRWVWEPAEVSAGANASVGFFSPQELVRALRPIAEDAARDPEIRQLKQANKALNQLASEYILRAFAAFLPAISCEFSLQEVSGKMGVLPRYARLWSRLCGILRDAGIFEGDGDRCRLTREVPGPCTPATLQGFLQRFPDLRAEITLLDRCATRLPDVLAGACDPLALIFPGGDFSLATHFYQTSPSARAMNGLVRAALRTAISAMPPGRRLRILEIGAGTGGTTTFVLPHVPKTAEYVFTDVSPLFLAKAQAAFKDYPFIRYQPFDVERDPRQQGFDIHAFDIVLAANVVHATADVRSALRHARDLVSPGGLFVLLEGSEPIAWVDLIFGLTEGWWKFTDTDLRPSYPLLLPAVWARVLSEEGFESAATVGLVDHAPELSSAPSVVVARTPRTASHPRDAAPGHWLIFVDSGGLGRGVAERLAAAAGERTTLVERAAEFESQDGHTFSIDPANAGHFRELLQAVGRSQPVTGVMHFWSLDAPPSGDLTDESLETAAWRLFQTSLYLVQAIQEICSGSPPRIWWFTRGAVAVGDELSLPGLSQSLLWGLGKTIALEFPALWGGLVDLSPSDAVDTAVEAVVRSVQEMPGEDFVAVRNQTFHRARVVAEWPTLPVPAKFDPRAAYLITGGWGALGLKLATWMTENSARHILLLGRRRPSPEARTRIAELRSAGCEIQTVQADVCDRHALENVLERVRSASLPLRGVIHAAGSGSYSPLDSAEFPALYAEMRPKVMGAWHLHELTKDMPLDFFVTYSSMVSLWGARGQGAYAAANQFLDTLVHYRRRCGLPGLSVNWGLWASDDRAGLIKQLAPMGVRTLRPKVALETLGGLLETGIAQIAVADIDWSLFKGLYEARRRWPLFERIGIVRTTPAASNKPSLRAELEQAALRERFDLLRAHIKSELAAVIGLSLSQAPADHQGFFDLGMDSLMAVELKSRLESSLNCTLSPTLAFDHPTVDALTRYIFTSVLQWDLDEEPRPSPPTPVEPDPVAAVSHLTSEQVEDSISRELSELEAMLRPPRAKNAPAGNP